MCPVGLETVLISALYISQSLSINCTVRESLLLLRTSPSYSLIISSVLAVVGVVKLAFDSIQEVT